MSTATIQVTTPASGTDEAPYHDFLGRMQTDFAFLTGGRPLFTVEVNGDEIWAMYLEAIPSEHRQHHTCHTCKDFIRRYGNLVVVDEDGVTETPVWFPAYASQEIRMAISVLANRVANAPVTGVFLSSEKCWGTPRTPDPKSGTVWQHFCVHPTKEQIYRAGVLTAGQRMAELKEDYRCLQLALTEFKPEVLTQARTILEADALARSEKFLGIVKWLQYRQEDRKERNAKLRTNRLWKAVATAPAGFCKPRASMVGSLLEDILAGMPFEDVKRRFDAKMHPLQYQRPQAAPSAGNIKQAEEAFAKLGLASALQRRFATLADVLAWVWQPVVPQDTPSGAGLFGHLKPKGKAEPPALNLPERTLTWIKFRDEILPTAERLEIQVPTVGNFCAFVTASDPEAKPLLQWDRDERRNPVNYYVWFGGSSCQQWGLSSGRAKTYGVTSIPSGWQDGYAHLGEGLLFVIENARESRDGGLALFPEHLRSELHGVRATIEAHSKSGKIQSSEGQQASGLLFLKGQAWTDCRLSVTSRGNAALYRLDRWD